MIWTSLDQCLVKHWHWLLKMLLKKVYHVMMLMERVMEQKMGIDYSNALPQKQRLNHPLVQTALATSNYFRRPGTPEILPVDVGSTDANIAVSMGIPAVAVGATLERMPHRLEENTDASSILPGIKSFIALAVALSNH